MRITYYYPDPADYEGDWDRDASLQKLDDLVRASINSELPKIHPEITTLMRRPRIRMCSIQVFDYYPSDIAAIVEAHLSSIVEGIESESVRWLVPKKPGLKPCPFCGGDARAFADGAFHGVACRRCGAKTQLAFSHKAVMRLWNARA